MSLNAKVIVVGSRINRGHGLFVLVVCGKEERMYIHEKENRSAGSGFGAVHGYAGAGVCGNGIAESI